MDPPAPPTSAAAEDNASAAGVRGPGSDQGLLRQAIDHLMHPGRALNVALAVIVLAVALTPFLSPSKRDLYPSDETRYSEIVREMSSQHSLLVLTLDGQTYSHKPPLHFWMMYGLTRVFGETSAWPYVLPSLAGYLVTIAVIGWLALGMFGRGAMTSIFIFSTFYFVWGASQIARMDAGFSALVALGLLFVWRFIESEDPRNLLFGAIAIGMAMLTKGPMALVIALVTLLFEWLRRRSLPRGGYTTFVAVAVAIPLLWLIPAGVIGGSHYVRELVVEQNVGRAIEAFDHQKPVWFYLLRSPLIFFPWFALLLVAIAAAIRRSTGAARNAYGFCMSWMLAVVIPFSLISGKLDIYMLPAFVPAALMIGGFLTERLEPGWAKVTTVVNRLLVGAAGAAFLALAILSPDVFHEPLARSVAALPEIRSWLWWSAAAAAVALLLQLTVARKRLLTTAVIAGATLMFPLVFTALRLGPVVNSLQSTTALVAALDRQDVDWSEIVLVESPYVWSRDISSDSVSIVRIADDDEFPIARRPKVVVAGEEHEREQDRFALILRDYVKVDSVFVRGRRFGIYRLGSG
jgi:4-amino-4-deoxy-L-arabinose transferase-like glycosyltransferase